VNVLGVTYANFAAEGLHQELAAARQRQDGQAPDQAGQPLHIVLACAP